MAMISIDTGNSQSFPVPYKLRNRTIQRIKKKMVWNKNWYTLKKIKEFGQYDHFNLSYLQEKEATQTNDENLQSNDPAEEKNYN